MANDWLIFVDTNVYLDFYRQSGEKAKRQMDALERHKDRLIISEQIRMEFLKNRQKVILTAFDNIKPPARTSVPQILTGTEPARLLQKSEIEAMRRYKQLRDRVQNLLAKPANYDDVYKSINRIFNSNCDFNLKRPDKARFELRSRARKRFSLGYPPRKVGDTSIGDCYNWEWIIECAKKSNTGQHILIVSRDNDYGAQFGGESYLNDWLIREFKDRVSSRRQIRLTSKLTDALKRLDEVVTVEDEKEEQILINSTRKISLSDLFLYSSRGAASRLLLPDPEVEAFLGDDPEIDYAIPDVSDIPEIDEIGVDFSFRDAIDE